MRLKISHCYINFCFVCLFKVTGSNIPPKVSVSEIDLKSELKGLEVSQFEVSLHPGFRPERQKERRSQRRQLTSWPKFEPGIFEHEA
jgi:hypothetical protein